MRVLVLAPYPLDRAPSQRFRWEQYVEPLRTRGIELEPSCLLTDADMDIIHVSGAWSRKGLAALRGGRRRVRDIIAARGYDLVLVHRESFPLGPAWVERLLRTINVPYAFDFDDAIYLGDVSDANQRLSRLNGAHRTEGVVRHAALVLAGNDDLAAWARRYSSEVVVIPTTVDTDIYRPVARRSDAAVCVGWTGSMSTIKHLDLLAPVLRDLQREAGIRIRVIGDPDYEIDGARVDARPWSRATELEDLLPIDIGIMPLPDDEWARGKCGLKALQYMALGIPTVLSPVGVNTQIARQGAAVLARTPAEWADALRALINDPGLRARTGDAGRLRVEREYSVTAVSPLWERALRDAAASGRR
jgi:glycosyltransferase involved in cell wall biosynthesis